MSSNIIDILDGLGKNCKIYTLNDSSVQRRVTVHDYEAEALENYFKSRTVEVERIGSVSKSIPSTRSKQAPLFRTRQPFGIPGIE